MGSPCSLRTALDEVPPRGVCASVLRSPCSAAPVGTDFIPPSVVIFFCAFPADNIGDRTSVLHSTPVRHPAFSWYLAIVFFLAFFFLFLNKPCEGSHREERTHGNTQPKEINGFGFSKAWCVLRKTQGLEPSHFQDSTEGNAWAGIICACEGRGILTLVAVPHHNCPLSRGEQDSSQMPSCFTEGLRSPNPEFLLSSFSH